MVQKILLLIISLLVISSCAKKDSVIQFELKTSILPVDGGTISPTSGLYKKGESVILTAIPSSEYLFTGWSDGASGTTNPLTVVMNSGLNITATFEKRKYPLSLNIVGDGTIKEEVVATKSAKDYPSGTLVKLTALPNKGYSFIGWSGDLVSTDNPVTMTISGPKTLNATFQKIYIPQTIYETSTKNHEWNNGFESLLLSSFSNPYKPLFISGYTYFDYNNDGIFDIFGRDDNSPDGIFRLHVCVNDGQNNWTEVPNVIETQTFNLYRKIVAADIDNDGDIDFVGFIAEDANSNIVNPHNDPAGGIDIFRNEKGTFKLEHVVPLTVGNDFFFHTGVLADINHDGWIDIVAGGGPIKVFLNDGTGHFKNQYFETGFKIGSGEFDFHGETAVFELEAADVNNDGYVDLLAGFARNVTSYPTVHSDLSTYSLTAQVFYGTSTYPFISNTPYILPTNYKSQNATPPTLSTFFDCTMDFAISDLNNDGYIDLLTWNVNANGIAGNSAIELYENNKDGTFKNITNSLFDKGENEFLGVGNWFKIWDIDKDGEKEILFEVTPNIGNGGTNNFNGWKKVSGKYKKTILHPVYI